MIRLMCPQCQSIVSVSDAAAGGDTDCPSCGKSFAVPAKYTPVVAVEKPPEPPPPEPEPPAIPDRPPPPPGLIELPGHAAAAASAVYAHHRSVKLCPSLLAWLPVVGLVVILLLTFFPWVGMYPDGNPGYTQSPWGAMVGNFTSGSVIEDMLKIEGKLRERITWDWVMLPYFVGLFFAGFLAVTERLFHKRTTTPPPKTVAWMGSLWSHRILILTAIAATLLCLLVIQMLAGFGLENAIKKEVADRFVEERQKAGNITADQNRIDIREDMLLGSYRLQRTTWFCLAFWLNVFVVIALLGRMALDRRGNKPPPRVVVEY